MGMNYNVDFYDQITAGAIKSAEIILPQVLKITKAKSVIDFGCGRGAWLSVAKKNGIQDILGVDGDYVTDLIIAEDEFLSIDLEKPFATPRKFDLAMSLEVAEHLPKDAEDAFFNSLMDASDNILFSGAVPGQGGVNHINENWHTYWAQKFLDRGFVGSGDIRWCYWNSPSVENWYKQNLLFFTMHPQYIHDMKWSTQIYNVIHPNNWITK